MDKPKVQLKTDYIAGHDDYALIAVYDVNGKIAGYMEIDYKKVREELDILN